MLLKEDRLWDKTQQTLNGQNLYPCNTLESSPSEVKSESKIEKTEQNSAEQASYTIKKVEIELKCSSAYFQLIIEIPFSSIS